MNVRLEEWLDQMRQAQHPGPLVRVVVARGGRGETWTFDVTDKTDLEELAERMEATVRDANCRRCEMRAVDAEGKVIDNFIYRPDQAALAQVVGPAAGSSMPFEVTESITAALRSHRSFAVLTLKGMAENQQHAKDIITDLRTQNIALVDALTDGRRERAEEVAAIRAESGAEIVALRKENAELRERISKQWEMEDDLRSKYVDKQESLEKTKVVARILGALGEAGVAQFFPNGSAGQHNMRQQMAEQFLDSTTKEQTDVVLPLLSQEQLALLGSFVKLGVQAQAVATETNPEVHDAAVAAAKANGASVAKT